ncbi:CBS domain-containing protein [Sphaerisporangium perillae]|uniref:CBS domain-containing protein n=1 Tax=Sphaerisporangium perillae TaxID=2935860 RepID=UPI00200C48A6|nr:CBS domain-containing protein [Sphaerisporangium perillae]
MDIQTLTAADVMTRVVVTVKPDESPLMAWELMRRGGVHHLPVVDARSHVLGVLKREDIASHWTGGPAEQSSGQVRHLLGGRRCPHVAPETVVPTIAATMVDSCVDVVPVVGDSGTLEGLVTATDVLRAVAGRRSPAIGPTEVVGGLFRLEPVLPPKHPRGM